MSVPLLLIDGYNLLFQSNFVGRGRGPNWLAKARLRLLRRIEQSLRPEQLRGTHIIFDAPKVGVAPQEECLPSGVRVAYAVDHAEADDLLEELIRRHPTPKRLTVVSSDLRIRRCARARRAESLAADDFLDDLERLQGAQTWRDSEGPPPGQGKTETPSLSDDEVSYWLKAFAPPARKKR